MSAERSPGKIRLTMILGDGGHTQEMIRLADLLGDRFEYSYVMTKDDRLSTDWIKIPGSIHRITKPRGKSTRKPAVVWLSAVCLVESMGLMLKQRPKFVICNGPAVSVPTVFAAKLVGAKIIFIETASRVTRLSLTGRMMRHLADMFFVQWEELLPRYPEALYAGRLI